jgi:anti-sigma factor RsiW
MKKTSGVSREDLQLYFDGELTGSEAHELAAQIEADPELHAELQQLGILSDLVSEGLTRIADTVPQARFEQIWDEINRAIDREERESAPSVQPSIWSRLLTALRPARLPLAAAIGAVAVALVAVNTMGDGDSENKAAESPSVAVKKDAEAPGGPQAAPSTKVAARATPELETEPEPEPALEFPEPKPIEADIHRVNFGGHNGRITKAGTVTVLFVEEDAEPEDSERSL